MIKCQWFVFWVDVGARSVGGRADIDILCKCVVVSAELKMREGGMYLIGILDFDGLNIIQKVCSSMGINIK